MPGRSWASSRQSKTEDMSCPVYGRGLCGPETLTDAVRSWRGRAWSGRGAWRARASHRTTRMPRMASPCHSPCSITIDPPEWASRSPTRLSTRTTSSPSSPPYSAAGGSNSRTSGSRGIAASGTYGGFDTTTETDPSRSPNACSRSTKARLALSAPTSSKFSFAQTKASTEFSAAYTRACGTSEASARARAPLPVPRSTAIGEADATARSASIASCATISVSGRGTNTPGPTRSSRWRNGAVPVMCCKGSRVARRETSCSMRSASAAGIASPRITAACTAPRGSPRTWPASSSASTTGSRTPVWARRDDESRRTSERARGGAEGSGMADQA